MRGIKVCLGLGSHAMTLGHTLHLHTLIHTHTTLRFREQVETTDTVIVNSTATANPKCQMSHKSIFTTTLKEILLYRSMKCNESEQKLPQVQIIVKHMLTSGLFRSKRFDSS